MSIKIAPQMNRTQWVTDFAKKNGKKVTTIPLKDKSSVKILSGENDITFFEIKNNEIRGAKGYQGSKEGLKDFAINTLEKIQELALDGVNVFKEFTKTLIK